MRTEHLTCWAGLYLWNEQATLGFEHRAWKKWLPGRYFGRSSYLWKFPIIFKLLYSRAPKCIVGFNQSYVKNTLIFSSVENQTLGFAYLNLVLYSWAITPILSAQAFSYTYCFLLFFIFFKSCVTGTSCWVPQVILRTGYVLILYPFIQGVWAWMNFGMRTVRTQVPRGSTHRRINKISMSSLIMNQ